MRNLKKVETRTRVKVLPLKHREHTMQKESQLLAKISHELRTPLNAIIGFSEMICHEKAGAINKEQREYLNDILASAKELLLRLKNTTEQSKKMQPKKSKKRS